MREFSEKPLEACLRCEEGLTDENLRMKKAANFVCLFFRESLSLFFIITLWLVSFITNARARLRERESAEKKESALREESVVHQLVARARRERERE